MVLPPGVGVGVGRWAWAAAVNGGAGDLSIHPAIVGLYRTGDGISQHGWIDGWALASSGPLFSLPSVVVVATSRVSHQKVMFNLLVFHSLSLGFLSFPSNNNDNNNPSCPPSNHSHYTTKLTQSFHTLFFSSQNNSSFVCNVLLRIFLYSLCFLFWSVFMSVSVFFSLDVVVWCKVQRYHK
jgi:hypothetical protein